MASTHFTKLLVWQRSMDLAVDVYELTERFPANERSVLAREARRTAISIPANIAEGANRNSPASFANHLNIALGSEGELHTQLELAHRLRLVPEAQLVPVLNQLAEIGKMLNGLLRSVDKEKRRAP